MAQHCRLPQADHRLGAQGKPRCVNDNRLELGNRSRTCSVLAAGGSYRYQSRHPISDRPLSHLNQYKRRPVNGIGQRLGPTSLRLLTSRKAHWLTGEPTERTRGEECTASDLASFIRTPSWVLPTKSFNSSGSVFVSCSLPTKSFPRSSWAVPTKSYAPSSWVVPTKTK